MTSPRFSRGGWSLPTTGVEGRTCSTHSASRGTASAPGPRSARRRSGWGTPTPAGCPTTASPTPRPGTAGRSGPRRPPRTGSGSCGSGAAELRPGRRDRRHDARIRTGRIATGWALIEAGAEDALDAGITRAGELEATGLPTYIRKPGEFFGAVERTGLPTTLADSTIRVAPRPGLRGPAGPPPHGSTRAPRPSPTAHGPSPRSRPRSTPTTHAPGSEPPSSPTEGYPSRGRHSESASERSPKRLRPTPCPRARAAAPRRPAASSR